MKYPNGSFEEKDTPLYFQYLDDQINDSGRTTHDKAYYDYLFDILLSVGIEMPCSLRLLDVGTRALQGGVILEENGFRVQAVGIDISRETLEYADQHGLDIRNIDAHKMSGYFKSGEFDFVTAFHSLEHMYDMPHVIANCFSVLKPGGLFYVAVPVPSENWRRGHWWSIDSAEEFELVCKGKGFETLYIEHVRDLNGPHQGLRGEEAIALFQKPKVVANG